MLLEAEAANCFSSTFVLILLCDFSFPFGPPTGPSRFGPARWELPRGLVPVVDACLLRSPQRPVDDRRDPLGARRGDMQQLREDGTHLRRGHRRRFFPRRSFSDCRNHRANNDSVMWWCQPVQLRTS
jgi:hypothetical protein